MNSEVSIARALAIAFLSGPLEVDGLVDRSSHLLGQRWRWLRPLARRIVENFAGPTPPRQVTLQKFIVGNRGFQNACLQNYGLHDLELVNPLDAVPVMCPAAAAESWDVLSIRTAGELAEWLDVTVGELEWFADIRRFEYKRNHGRLRHYHYRMLAKRFGQVRLIESPKPRLKHIQRRILASILDSIPPHVAVHGFRHGCSIKTFAAPHVGKNVVLKIDLHDFFPSISETRIRALFRTVGYPELVADLLAGICTNSVPRDIWVHDTCGPRERMIGQALGLYSRPHLPQGAPTSPALANLGAFKLDCRLAGLARSAGAVYTRYADDLAFSGDRNLGRIIKRFHIHVCAIVMEEGFTVHHRKTRIMRQGVRQHLAGLVVNERLNVRRADFDRLKATLTNCIRHGPETQNRNGHTNYRSHLEGRISFVEMVNQTRGHQLRQLFNQILW